MDANDFLRHPEQVASRIPWQWKKKLLDEHVGPMAEYLAGLIEKDLRLRGHKDLVVRGEGKAKEVQFVRERVLKNISFRLTRYPFEERRKTVTRRTGWSDLKPGEKLCGVYKSQGLKRGECVERLGEIEIVSVTREPLKAIVLDRDYGRDEMAREGFPLLEPMEFIDMFCRSHYGTTIDSEVNRIEFRHLSPMDDYALERRARRRLRILSRLEESETMAVALGSNDHQDLLEMETEELVRSGPVTGSGKNRLAWFHYGKE